MLSLDCHFKFPTNIKAKGSSKEDVLERLTDILNNKIIPISKETFVKELSVEDIEITPEHGYYEVEVYFEGFFNLNSNEIPIVKTSSDAISVLEDVIYPLKDLMKEYFKTTSFILCRLGKFNITNIVEN